MASFISIVCFADLFNYLIKPEIFKAIPPSRLKYCVTVLVIIPEISSESVMTGAHHQQHCSSDNKDQNMSRQLLLLFIICIFFSTEAMSFFSFSRSYN